MWLPGILLVYLSNHLVSQAGFGAAEWRWKLGVAALPALAFFLALAAGRHAEARAVLVRMGESDPDAELDQISKSLHAERMGGREPLFQRRYRIPVFLAISIGMFNQLSGTNAILYYLNDIFERAGFSRISSDMQAVSIGFTNLIFTCIAMSVIDRLGRKKLLLTGATGTGLCLAGVAAIFATAISEDHPRSQLNGSGGAHGIQRSIPVPAAALARHV